MKKIIVMLFAGLVISTVTFAQKMSTNKVPTAVQGAFKTKFPSASKAQWEMEGATEYEVNFNMNKEEHSAKFDKDGKWLETEIEIEISKLPKAVSDVLKEKFAGYKINEAEQAETFDKGTVYEVEMDKGEQRFDIRFSPAGEILDRAVEKIEKEKKDDKK